VFGILQAPVSRPKPRESQAEWGLWYACMNPVSLAMNPVSLASNIGGLKDRGPNDLRMT
jgi:hypothetical protein